MSNTWRVNVPVLEIMTPWRIPDSMARLQAPPVHLVWSVLLILCTCASSSLAVVPYQCERKLDITFIMDQSESIRENDPYDKPDYNWKLFKAFVRNVTQNLPVGAGDTHIAMIKYSSLSEVMWPLNQYSYAIDVEDAVQALHHQGGNTNTAEALQQARERVFTEASGDRADARNIIILMTDGLSTVRARDVFTEARLTREAGIEIYVVSIGKYTDQEELRGIVEDFSKNIVSAENFERLPAIEELLVYRVCGLPDPEPENKPPPNCKIMDLAFVIDNSGSIRDKNKDGDNYDRLKDFVANLVEQLEIGENRTRVAAVRFSDQAQLVFDLDDYHDKRSVQATIRSMPFRGSHTNTSGAIRLMMRDVFVERRGDRRDVRNVAIIVTDGESTREKNQTIPEAIQARRRGVELYVIGVTDEINEDELKGIASTPQEDHIFDSTDIRYLNALLYNLLRNVCS